MAGSGAIQLGSEELRRLVGMFTSEINSAFSAAGASHFNQIRSWRAMLKEEQPRADKSATPPRR